MGIFKKRGKDHTTPKAVKHKIPEGTYEQNLTDKINELYYNKETNRTNLAYTLYVNGANYCKEITWDKIREWMESKDYKRGFFTTATNVTYIVEEMIKAFDSNIEIKSYMQFDIQDCGQYNTFRKGAEWFRDNYLTPLLHMQTGKITLDLLKSIE